MRYDFVFDGQALQAVLVAHATEHLGLPLGHYNIAIDFNFVTKEVLLAAVALGNVHVLEKGVPLSKAGRRVEAPAPAAPDDGKQGA